MKINHFEEAIQLKIDDAIDYAEVRLTEAQIHTLFEIALERAEEAVTEIIGDLINEIEN